MPPRTHALSPVWTDRHLITFANFRAVKIMIDENCLTLHHQKTGNYISTKVMGEMCICCLRKTILWSSTLFWIHYLLLDTDNIDKTRSLIQHFQSWSWSLVSIWNTKSIPRHFCPDGLNTLPNVLVIWNLWRRCRNAVAPPCGRLHRRTPRGSQTSPRHDTAFLNLKENFKLNCWI